MSRFTCLKILKLYYVVIDLETHVTLLEFALSNFSSRQLEKLEVHVEYHTDCAEAFAPAFTALSDLREIDEILARPQFSSLRSVVLDYALRFYPFSLKHPLITVASTPPVFAPGASEEPARPEWADTSQISQRPWSDSDERKTVLTRCAQDLIWRKIHEELRRLHLRGILDVQLDVDDLPCPNTSIQESPCE